MPVLAAVVLIVIIAYIYNFITSISWYWWAGIGGSIPILFIILCIYYSLYPVSAEEIEKIKQSKRHPLHVLEYYYLFKYESKRLVTGSQCNGIALRGDRDVAVKFPNSVWEIIPIDKIIDISISYKEKVSIRTSSSRSLTGAIAGGAIAGPIGAIVGGTSGSTTSTQRTEIEAVFINISVKDLARPLRIIGFSQYDASAAQEWYARLKAVLNI